MKFCTLASGSSGNCAVIKSGNTAILIDAGISMRRIKTGLAACGLLPEDKNLKILGINNRVLFGIGFAAFCSVFEIFLAWPPAFIWVYPWWGAIPVFITTYIPFFVGAYLVYDLPAKKQWTVVGTLVCVNIALLAILIPLGII